MTDEITFDDFMKVDIRVGRVVRAEPFPEARKPAITLWVDFGEEIGEKKSSAQLTAAAGDGGGQFPAEADWAGPVGDPRAWRVGG